MKHSQKHMLEISDPFCFFQSITFYFQVFVTVGQTDILKWDVNSENFLASRVITHELYNQTTLENDIALIELNDEIALSDDVKIACLPRPGLFTGYSVRNRVWHKHN